MSQTAEQIAAGLAAPFEGFSSAPYLDPVGVPTIGYGSIWIGGCPPERVTLATPPIDEPTARAWLCAELAQAAATIASDVTVPLTVQQTAALEDFIYNLGSGAFASSTLLRRLNAGDFAGAATEIDRWDHAGGQVLAGLLRRRQAETDLFNQSPAGGLPASA